MTDQLKRASPSQLSPRDREQYERYPLIGAALLAEIPGTEEVVALLKSHCECFDGSGFPEGLKGEGIPIGARIIRLADSYDTFLMHHQGENAHEDAKRYLADARGRAHDPDLFKYAIAYVDEQSGEPETRAATVVPSGELMAGMVLAESVYDDEGRFLARKGTELTDHLAFRLGELCKRRSLHVYAE